MVMGSTPVSRGDDSLLTCLKGMLWFARFTLSNLSEIFSLRFLFEADASSGLGNSTGGRQARKEEPRRADLLGQDRAH